MRVTVKDVAARCGLSVTTVIEALGRKADAYRPETRERVVEAARELGYRPNSSAQAVRSGRFGCVALLQSTDPGRSYFPTALLDGIDGELARRNMHLTFSRMPDEKLTNGGHVPKLLRQWTADGLLVNYHIRAPRRMRELITRSAVPSVWINLKENTDCVHPDDFGAGRMATEHLIGLGHRRIAYVDFSHEASEPAEHYSADDRRAGCIEAARRAGIEPLTCVRRVPGDERDEFAKALLSASDRATAVVTYSSVTARRFHHVATGVLRMKVPEDLSIVSFSDGAIATDSGVPITTLRLPWTEVGRAAVGMLEEKIEMPRRPLSTRAVPFELVEGETSAPPVSSGG
jgi:LacI family transcriptional regulator